MAVTIRPAVADDVEAIFDIRTSVKENHLSRQQMAALGITPETTRQAIEQQNCIWVAQIDSELAGFSSADIATGCLFAVFIRPEFENHGLGKLLLKAAENRLFELHDRIWLETDSGSRASGFYRHQGWTIVSRFDNGDIRFEKLRRGA